MNTDLQDKYVCYFKPSPPDLLFEKNFKATLVQDEDQAEEILSKVGAVAGFDTETRTLDHGAKMPIVGFSLAFDGMSGYYFPLRHATGKNLSLRVLKKLDAFLRNNRLLLYNSAFDFLMLEAEGIKTEDLSFFDVMVLVYNADTNIERNSLKWAEEHFLGRKRKDFQETVGKNATFDLLTPEEGCFYASADPAGTLALFYKLQSQLSTECGEIIKIDNRLMQSMIYYLSNEVWINKELMIGMAGEARQLIREVERRIFQMIGYPLALDSNRQLSQALLSLGLDTGIKTKTGDMKLDEKTLSKLKHPIIQDVIDRNSLSKQLGSYIEKFTRIDKGRLNFMTCRIPTGRLASGNKDNPFYMQINGQNLTKTDSALFKIVPDNSPTNILGYRFDLAPKIVPPPGQKPTGKQLIEPGSLYSESMDPQLNVRRAFTVPNLDTKSWYFVTIDFSQEELMVAGQLANEPVMMKAFTENEDLHKITAMTMWGKEQYNKDRRKQAKICNFGLLYDGTAWTLQKASGLPIEVCEELYNKYWETMATLRRWKKQQVSLAYQRGGVVYTAFGRPRRLAHYLAHPDMAKRRFGERSVTSHIVQGSCGDVMRICLVKLYKEFFRIYTEDLRFVNAVHDEIDFVVRKNRFDELVPKIAKTMEILVPGCKLPLRTDISVGYDYGTVFSFEKKDDSWVPKAA